MFSAVALVAFHCVKGVAFSHSLQRSSCLELLNVAIPAVVIIVDVVEFIHSSGDVGHLSCFIYLLSVYWKSLFDFLIYF